MEKINLSEACFEFYLNGKYFSVKWRQIDSHITLYEVTVTHRHWQNQFRSAKTPSLRNSKTYLMELYNNVYETVEREVK